MDIAYLLSDVPPARSPSPVATMHPRGGDDEHEGRIALRAVR
jgi:hypothetical protein